MPDCHEVQAGDDLQVAVGIALEAVGAVEALEAVAGDGDGDLGLPLGGEVQILDAPLGCLAGSADIGDFGVPQVGDGGAHGVEGARLAG